MPKLKDLLPGFFSGSKESKVEQTPTKVVVANGNVGKLEFDALPVPEPDSEFLSSNISNTPTASTELTESVVRELSDPNYNSLALTTNGNDTGVAPTLNTMNVHNAQQQVVMQFSNANNLHFGSVYNFNNPISPSSTSSRKNSGNLDETTLASTSSADWCGKQSQQQRQTPRKTTSIVAMMRDQEEPNHRMLDTIATHLGEGWKQVMRDLGHSEGQIEQALIDHQLHGGIKEVIYQLLLQWVQNADDDAATIGFITQLLWESQHRDCVQRMKLVWKSEPERKKTEL